jgi:murein DD-endopeptidase MepM/ murein hydrolase activator NlpD
VAAPASLPRRRFAITLAVAVLGLTPALLRGQDLDGAALGAATGQLVATHVQGQVGPAAVGPAGSAGPRPVGERGVHSRASWGWPLDPVPRVVRRFEPPPEPWAAGHRGVDLLGSEGRPVLAAGDGVVSFSGVVAGRGVVTVRHAGGWRTTYEPVEDRVRRGTQVRRGEPIGTLGSRDSHCALRACLHWGALAGPRDYRDPLSLLGLVRPVLLPWR